MKRNFVSDVKSSFLTFSWMDSAETLVEQSKSLLCLVSKMSGIRTAKLHFIVSFENQIHCSLYITLFIPKQTIASKLHF